MNSRQNSLRLVTTYANFLPEDYREDVLALLKDYERMSKQAKSIEFLIFRLGQLAGEASKDGRHEDFDHVCAAYNIVQLILQEETDA